MILVKNFHDLPKESGVYWFKDVDGEVIYVGSSKNLKNRFAKHLDSIRHPDKVQSQKELYDFLSKNSFTVEYLPEENFRQREQELIDEFHPRFNYYKAYTGIISTNDNEYFRNWHNKYRQEHLNLMKDYTSRLCFFEGEVMTFNVLRKKLKKMGVEHPCKMAKEYLVPQNVIEGLKLIIDGLERVLEKLFEINNSLNNFKSEMSEFKTETKEGFRNVDKQFLNVTKQLEFVCEEFHKNDQAHEKLLNDLNGASKRLESKIDSHFETAF